jgi:predicted DNA-binding transcriptional regulator AlpA
MATATMSRIDELNDLLVRARRIDVRNDAEFRSVLRDAPSVLEMSESQIADALSISRPTFNRWINGRSLPHIAMRTPAITWLAEQLNSRIRHRSTDRRSA